MKLRPTAEGKGQMRSAVIIASMALCGTGFAAPAQSAQFGLYAGVSYAQTDRAADRAEFEALTASIYEQTGFIPLQTSATFDTKDASYGFNVGYRLLEHLALEGGYMDLGTVKYRDRSSGEFANGTPSDSILNSDSSTSGIALSALGILPLTYRWEIYARGGFLLSSSSLNVYLQDAFGPAQASTSKSGFDVLAGVGTTLSFLEIYNLRLEFLRVLAAGERQTGGQGDADLLTLGITVSF